MKLTVKKTQLKRLSNKQNTLPQQATPHIAGGHQGASISAGILCEITSLVNCSGECSLVVCPQ